MNRVAMESGEKESRGGCLNHRTMRTCRRFPPPAVPSDYYREYILGGKEYSWKKSESRSMRTCKVSVNAPFAFEYSKNLIIAIGSRRSSSRKNIIENIESSKNHRRQPRHGSSNSLLRNLSTKEFKHYRTNSKLFHRVRINLIYWIYINRSHECNPASSLSKSLNQKLEWVLPSHLLFRRDRLRRTVFLGARNNPRPADFSRLIKPHVHDPWPGVGSLPPL